MKKITLFFFLIAVSLGYSQTVLEDFEGTAPTFNKLDGFGTIEVAENPTNAAEKSLKLITSTTSAGWQGGEMLFQGDKLDLSTANKEVTISVYSTIATDILAKVVTGGTPSATDASHGGSGWETLTFNFANGKDNTGAADGIYSNLIFYPAWNNEGGTCTNGCYSGSGVDSSPDITLFVDDITGIAGTPPETCDDGIMNNGETGVDCGGPNCDACDVLPPLSPDPTSGTGNTDADVLSIFTDEGQFTNNYGTDFAFGEEFRSIINLGTEDAVNNVVKLELDRGGWGAGNNTEVELIAAGFTHFNFSYFMPTSTAGTEGHLLQATLVSRTPGQAQAPDAVVNITGAADAPNSFAALEFDKWVNLSIPLSSFTSFETHLLLFKFGTPSTAFSPLVYIDNVFFSKSAVTLSTKNNSIEGFSMYPNPASNQLNISAKELISNVEVFNVLGKRVKSFSLNATKEALDISDLNSGVYLVKFVSGGKLGTAKFIKQ